MAFNFPVTIAVGQRYRFRSQEFWAEDGWVCVEDQRTGEYRALPRAEAAATAIQFNNELPKIAYEDEREQLMRCIVNLAACVKEAKSQGDPTDAEISKKKAKERRRVSYAFHNGTPVALPGDQLPTTLVGVRKHSERFESLDLLRRNKNSGRTAGGLILPQTS